MYQFLIFILAVSGSTLLTACSTETYNGLFPKNKLRELQIEASSNANYNSPTAVDIVFVYDVDLIEVLPKTAMQWFIYKSEVDRNYPGSFDIVSLEIPPASVLNDIKFPDKHSAAISIRSYVKMMHISTNNYSILSEYKCAKIILTKEKSVHEDCDK